MFYPSSSPQMLGRPSSPLNPYAYTDRSSSPLTSPTPPTYYHFSKPDSFSSYPSSGNIQAMSNRDINLYIGKSGNDAIAGPSRMTSRMSVNGINRERSSPSSHNESSPSNRPTRFQRPTTKRSATSLTTGPTSDLFAEGTTPTEGAMWRERFTRRVEEREKRKKVRDLDLNKRRSHSENMISGDFDGGVDEEEADRRAQADDEEIFRRLMVLQRQKAQKAALRSHEYEMGGSDPEPPEFWEEESEFNNDRYRVEQQNQHPMSMTHLTPPPYRHTQKHKTVIACAAESEEERWAREAAEAEEAEREIEEAEIAKRVEDAYAKSVGSDAGAGTNEAIAHQRREMGDLGMDIDMDWEAFDSMDVE